MGKESQQKLTGESRKRRSEQAQSLSLNWKRRGNRIEENNQAGASTSGTGHGNFLEPSLPKKLKIKASICELNNNCSICFMPLSGKIASPQTCKHNFCLDCLVKWTQEKNTCPLDRKKYNHIKTRNHIGGKVLEKIKVIDVLNLQLKNTSFLTQAEQYSCRICHSRAFMISMIFCDICHGAYHTYCLESPISEINTFFWLCPDCSTAYRN